MYNTHLKHFILPVSVLFHRLFSTFILFILFLKVDGKGTSDSKKPAAETSSGTLEPACPSVNPCKTALQTSNGSDCVSKANEALYTAKLANESGNQAFFH